ncbi:unnamed protein product [Brassica rapa]|uniref:Uncharacterized protein n=1 Tax=Brassica campestris TaxID=3711 RepID=A0A8D9D0K5_BRACM|nr:unnamed protein product [Brassica rapa]
MSLTYFMSRGSSANLFAQSKSPYKKNSQAEFRSTESVTT